MRFPPSAKRCSRTSIFHFSLPKLLTAIRTRIAGWFLNLESPFTFTIPGEYIRICPSDPPFLMGKIAPLTELFSMKFRPLWGV